MQKPITVICDASPKGVGRELLKDDCLVAYTTRSLTEAESRYAHIEKKLLAVLFSLERSNQCTYGKKVHVESDKSISNGASQTTENSTENVKGTTIHWNTEGDSQRRVYKIFEKSSNADCQRQRPVSGLVMARVY